MRAIRLVMIWILGFASGLPLALTAGALQAWMTVDGLDIATIGFLSLVGLPYTFKFIWAPLMDRFEPPFLPRRKGWLFLTQLGVAGALLLISQVSPKDQTEVFALLAVLIAFLSASQDVVVDAYRTDILPPEERGLGSSLNVFGYRLAMILSGGVAFVWADASSGQGWNWPMIYQIMAGIMGGLALISALLLPNLDPIRFQAPKTDAKNDVLGFLALALAVFVGYQVTTRLVDPSTQSLFSHFFAASDGKLDPLIKRWVDFLVLLMGLALTLPIAWWAANKAKFETLNRSLKNYFSMKGAVGFLVLIILYKLGDAFAASLLTPFLIKGVGFAQAEIGVVNKVIGLWLTIVGALLGGALMMRLGLFRSLLGFGFLQLLSNLGFWMVAVSEKGSWGSFTLPAFDILIVSLKEPANVDHMLLFAVGLENITGGMGTAAFVAFLMALCNQKFTATQYALLSAFASVGRVWVGPLSGVLSVSIGWPAFFLVSTLAAVPGLWMLWRYRELVISLETPKNVSALDD